jgi:hypothetical protein
MHSRNGQHGQRHGQHNKKWNGHQHSCRKRKKQQPHPQDSELNQMPVRKAVACLCQNKRQIPGGLWHYIQRLINHCGHEQTFNEDGLMHLLAGIIDFDPVTGRIQRLDDDTYHRLCDRAAELVGDYFRTHRPKSQASAGGSAPPDSSVSSGDAPGDGFWNS